MSRNGLIRKRCHLWHNEKRNQQIATIAESFADGNWDRLTACGITVDAIQQQRQAIGQHPHIAILVESPEHARSLRRVLPGWRMATGRRLADQHLPTFPLDAQRVIITQARARAAGLAADVIIRADGTGQGWSKDYGPHWGFNGDNLIIVDLQDAFDMRARDSGYSRLADYRDRGWDVIELTACQALTR